MVWGDLSPIEILFIVLNLGLIASLSALTIFQWRLHQSLKKAPRLMPLTDIPKTLPLISVIIPAYNEEVNLRDCVEAVLKSQLPAPEHLQVLIVDDRSTDTTGEIAHTLAKEDNRVKVITVPPRPDDVVWRGKNWACAHGAWQATGDYLLFIDADVRLQPLAIATTVTAARESQADLYSCAPQIVCGCLAEWLVQPIMMSLIAVGFDFAGVNDPDDETAFAAGPFMLFRRASYESIDGHRGVAANLVEDVALARKIKQNGLKLHYTLALDLVKVRMYRSWGALWEGWTKNYYMGSQCNLGATLYSALVVILVFVMPWVGLVGGVTYTMLLVLQANLVNGFSLLLSIVLALSLVGVLLQYLLRLKMSREFSQPPRYWWLSWWGGISVAAIAIASIVKTETGWGWTWRGRSLSIKNQV